MDQVFVHSKGLLESQTVGPRTRIWAFAHVMSGAVVGSDCNIGECCFVEDGAVLGNRVVVKNGVQIWRGVTCEDDVFLGPNATLTNDPRPRAGRRDPAQYLATIIRQGASVGANATVLAGIEIGNHAMIGAGAVVTADVPAHAVVVGNPGSQIGWICVCGERLESKFVCTKCEKQYRQTDRGLTQL
jgi:UDP-2-acetamido-3-amino-2,3-dideoxy-glucuronate N-acetyltransferase